MQRREFKGLHKVSRKLADGTTRDHYYAWRGGPPIVDEHGDAPQFGSTEFVRVFERLTSPPSIEETVNILIDEYLVSTDFTLKSAKTQKDYSLYIPRIRAKFGSMTLLALGDKRVRGIFKSWRDGMSDTPCTADRAWGVLRRIMSFGVDRGKIDTNHCLRGGRLYHADRNDCIWSEENLTAIFAVSSFYVSAVIIMALWTGQRLSDCLKMKWKDVVRGKIRVRQNKGKRKLSIPVSQELAYLLGRLKADDHYIEDQNATILMNSRGKQWTLNGFETSYGRTFKASGIVDDLHFHDLRGTAVTRLAIAGCTAIQIAAITGHSEETIERMLQEHYLGGQVELAEIAMRKLEAVRGGKAA